MDRNLSLEKTMTVSEIARALGVDRTTITRRVKKLYPGLVKNGVTTRLNESHVTEVKKELSGVHNLGTTAQVKNSVTDLEKSETVLLAIQYLQESISKLKQENKILANKAEFFDQVASSKDAIEMKDAAKVLNAQGYGRNNLFQFLREQKILMLDNIPYQTFIDREYFRVIETKYTLPTGEIRINLKTLVYQKGLDFIRQRLKEKGGI